MPISNPDAKAINATVSPGRIWRRFEFFYEGDLWVVEAVLPYRSTGDHGIVGGGSLRSRPTSWPSPWRIARAKFDE